jgi:hypothetical protein
MQDSSRAEAVAFDWSVSSLCWIVEQAALKPFVPALLRSELREFWVMVREWIEFRSLSKGLDRDEQPRDALELGEVSSSSWISIRRTRHKVTGLQGLRVEGPLKSTEISTFKSHAYYKALYFYAIKPVRHLQGFGRSSGVLALLPPPNKM